MAESVSAVERLPHGGALGRRGNDRRRARIAKSRPYLIG